MNAIRCVVVLVLACGLFGLTPYAAEDCDTALLIVDVQLNLLAMAPGRLHTVYGKDILESIEPIVAACRDAGIPVIYSRYLSGPLVDNPDMVRFPESIAPQEGDFIVGREGFVPLDDELLGLLEEEGFSRIITAGLYSTCCINSAVRDASTLGYEAIVIEEGHGDYSDNLPGARAAQNEWRSLNNVLVVKFEDVNLEVFCTP